MADSATRHRLLAILAADAAGYSALMARDEAAALAALDAARDVFRRETAARQGRVVDTAGDSVLAVFDTAAGAVDCAVAVQLQLAGGQATTLSGRLPFRIGVHLGDVIEKADGSVYGNGVNVAARLQALAAADEIWVSDAVRAALGSGSRRLRDQGLHTVKNIDDAVHAYRLDWSGTGIALPSARRGMPRHAALWALAGMLVLGTAATTLLWPDTWRSAGATTGSETLRPLSVAVGPFAAAQGDSRAAEWADHLRGDLQSALSGPLHRNSLTVITVADSAGVSPLQGARAAGARYLVEGRIGRGANGNAVVVRLHDVMASAQAWSVDVEFADGATAAERANSLRKLARQISGVVFERESRRVLALPVDRLSAVESWVRGSAVYESNSTLAGIDEALSLADRSVTLDPQCISGLVLKAFLLGNRYDEEATPDHDRYVREIDTLTARALAVDARDPYAWSMRAVALRMAGQWQSAQEAVDKFVEIDASGVFGIVDKAELLVALGRPTEALRILDTDAVRSADDTWSLIVGCHARLLLDQPNAAIEACERAVGRDPKLWSAHLYLAAARARANDLERARASLAVLERMSPGQTIERLRQNRNWNHPAYQQLAEASYYPGLRQAGLRER